MKTNLKLKKLLLFVFILYGGLLQAQNLVPNPSFEDTVACPTSIIQTNKAKGWIINVNSADYYNSCASITSGVSVPKNCFGYQETINGNAYCGLYNYIQTPMGDVREYIGTRLSSPLTPNQKYFVSFKASWADGWCASNKLGALFSNIYYGDSTTWGALIVPPPLVNNFAQIYSNSIISDSVSWITITGSFFSDSAYQYIYIGNFFNRENVDTLWYYGGQPDCKSYYYIDDICVSIDSLSCNMPDKINEITNEKEFINVFPSPANDFIYFKLNTPQYNSYYCNIYDMLGKKIQTLTNPKIFNCTKLPRGIYFFQLIFANKIINKKIIIYH